MDKVELVSRENLEQELAVSLAAGELPDHFLYLGEEGAGNWLSLAGSEEYDISARLEELLRRSLEALVPRLPASPDVVSLGAGSGRKERLILSALTERGGRPSYFPLDISSPLIDAALEAVADLELSGCGLVAKVEALPRLAPCFRPPRLLCTLGNNFSNFEPGWLLPLLAAQIGPRDHLLLDLHVVPPDYGAAQAEVAGRYGCSLNQAFNLGPLLARGLNGEDCELSLELIEAPGLGWRTRKTIHLKRSAEVRCGGRSVRLAAGTTLRLGFTFKYTAQGIERLLNLHGFEVAERFATPDAAFLLLLLQRHQA